MPLKSELFDASSGSLVFTAKTKVFYFGACAGGGGGGGRGGAISNTASGGGGGGEGCMNVEVKCNVGDTFTAVIGAGGAGVGLFNGGNNGGDTTFAGYTLKGGNYGQGNNIGAGGLGDGNGGGYGNPGAGSGGVGANLKGFPSAFEKHYFVSGAGGGGRRASAVNAVGTNGGDSPGYTGGIGGGTNGIQAGGCGGGSSIFGYGQDGPPATSGAASPPVPNAATNYGAGGCGQPRTGNGGDVAGDGVAGCVFVWWTED